MTHMPGSRDNFPSLDRAAAGGAASSARKVPTTSDHSQLIVSRGFSSGSGDGPRSKFIGALLNHELALLVSLIILLMIPTSARAQQAWSNILDPSRATAWAGNVGFTVPSYSTNCPTQPSLATGSGNASANSTSIQNSIASCTSTQNVVNIPSGTYYVAGIKATNSNFVVRGAGPMSTYLYMTAGVSCNAVSGTANICFIASNFQYAQSANVNPGGSNACSWTAGYSQGTTQITINSCGTAPVANEIITLDQADDGADTGGIFICSTYDTVVNCTQKGNSSGQNAMGRVISGVQYSEEQQTLITSVVSGSGSGPYVINISPGLYFNNIRSSQTPGAWFPATPSISYAGIENLTLDFSNNTSSNTGFVTGACYRCWERNVRSIDGLEDHVDGISDLQLVIRDSYFYGSQHAGSESYAVQMANTSGALVENNIIQNTTSPDIKDAVTGSVSAYNFTPYINFGVYLQGMYASHNSGSAFNLLEGNQTTEFDADCIWGTSDLITMFRNQATGWQPGYTKQTFPLSINAGVRATNVIGNVLGQPGYHTQYEAYATSTTAGVYTLTDGGSTNSGSGTVNQSIYENGWTDTSGLGVCTTPPVCDPLVHSTMMRWGNYDVVDAAVEWNSTEASPGAVAYVNANSTPSSHTLPNSFYLSATTASSCGTGIGFWKNPTLGTCPPFPLIGPDVSSGNVGILTGGNACTLVSGDSCTGLWATAASQGGSGATLSSAWGGYVNANPAMVCYLSVMGGPPDGSGSVLSFDAASCYANDPASGDPTLPAPASPTNLTVVVH